MQCPVCLKRSLTAVELEPDLRAATCSACAGTWIARAHYDAWRARHPGDLPETPAPAQAQTHDMAKAKICPQCGRLLLRYRVGHGLAFSIDYCTACGGVWLDPSEWAAIRAKNLHDNLHQIISEQWQNDARQQAFHDALEHTYARLLGPDNYEKAKAARAWLRGQSQKSVILAYLAEKGQDEK